MSYLTLRPRPDSEEEPEEEVELKVGEARQVGSVEVTRAGSDLYVAQCGFCDWRAEHSTANTIGWLTYTHNRRRIKEGCS